MTTVQLSIHDAEYAQSLRNLLLRDGTHRVLVVDKPDLKVQGVVVVDSSSCADLSIFGSVAERFVVITRKGEDHLTRIWEAGVRHVVFEEDSPTTAQLAVIAAELRIPKTLGSPAYGPAPRAGGEKHLRRRSTLSVLNPQPWCSHCSFIQNSHRIF
jgi:hypothetical protein